MGLPAVGEVHLVGAAEAAPKDVPDTAETGRPTQSPIKSVDLNAADLLRQLVSYSAKVAAGTVDR
jgi:hypothetical protein